MASEVCGICGVLKVGKYYTNLRGQTTMVLLCKGCDLAPGARPTMAPDQGPESD